MKYTGFVLPNQLKNIQAHVRGQDLIQNLVSGIGVNMN